MSRDDFESQFPSDTFDIDATQAAKNRAIIPVDAAGETVTGLVKANAKVILATTRIGKDRIRDSRNALSESAFTHFELVSMLAVAIDRLAVHEALTPTPDIERAANKLELEFRKRCPATTLPDRSEIKRIARAVLDR